MFIENEVDLINELKNQIETNYTHGGCGFWLQEEKVSDIMRIKRNVMKWLQNTNAQLYSVNCHHEVSFGSPEDDNLKKYVCFKFAWTKVPLITLPKEDCVRNT